VSRDGAVLATGFNGFPRGVDDPEVLVRNKPEKLNLICHAEENVTGATIRSTEKVSVSGLCFKRPASGLLHHSIQTSPSLPIWSKWGRGSKRPPSVGAHDDQ